ncbi:MAG: putative sugar nucleotidyl transferase [Tepidisphaeraceae bacterium]
MHVVIFEGSRWDALLPLSLTRPTFMLLCGTSSLLTKQIRHLKPTRVTLWVRPELSEWCGIHLAPNLGIPVQVNTPLDDEPALLCNGRTLYLSHFERPKEECVFVEEGDFIQQAYVKQPGLAPEDVRERSQTWMSLRKLPQTMPQARFVAHSWDLISWNEEALIADSINWRENIKPRKDGPFHVINELDVMLAEGASLSPGCVLDASKGPIMLDRGASIGANAVIMGPCYVGEYSQIAPLAQIRPGCSIGPMCKVGGEVSNSIIIGYSNKAHEGYLGDSYVGEWVNLGAGTTTSNLKNTYGEVDMHIAGKTIATGRRTLGSVIGDHTKTAIGTRLTSGTYVGFNCMIAQAAQAPRFLKSLTFLTEKGPEPFEMEKAIDIAQRMLDRRHKRLAEVDEQVFRYAAEAAKLAEG